MGKNKFGDNLLLGFYENYAIVYSFEDENLYYYESEVIENMIGCVVEKDLLKKVDMLPEKEQLEIQKIFLEYGVGNNELLGFYENYAIVYSFEDENLYYYESEVIEDMIGCAVENEILKRVDTLSKQEQTEILKKYLKESYVWHM